MLTQEQIDDIYEDLGRPFHYLCGLYRKSRMDFSYDQVDPDSFEERKK